MFKGSIASISPWRPVISTGAGLLAAALLPPPQETKIDKKNKYIKNFIAPPGW